MAVAQSSFYFRVEGTSKLIDRLTQGSIKRFGRYRTHVLYCMGDFLLKYK